MSSRSISSKKSRSKEVKKNSQCGKSKDGDTISEKGNNVVPCLVCLDKGLPTEPVEYVSDDAANGFSIQEFVQYIKKKGQAGLQQEYEQIIAQSEELSGPYNACKKRINLPKNRYLDVPCYDSTRVILSTSFTSVEKADECSDYIHANFVEGCNQKNAYIATQGPLPNTIADFWKMVWEQNSLVIVMVTRIIETGRIKCSQYWPLEMGCSATYGNFRVENMESDETNSELRTTRLKLTNNKQVESRVIVHLQFLSWPDFGIPSNPTIMLDFIQTMRNEQSLGVIVLGNKWNGHALGPPIIIHCSAGLGRTGTLITIDICTKRIGTGKRIDIRKTVEALRSQRAYSIQSTEQYLFCYATIIAFIKEKELIASTELDGISIA